MTMVSCDVCGKKISAHNRGDTPGKGVGYITYLDKDICPDCQDEVDFNLRRLTRSRDPYALTDAKSIHTQLVNQMCKSKS